MMQSGGLKNLLTRGLSPCAAFDEAIEKKQEEQRRKEDEKN